MSTKQPQSRRRYLLLLPLAVSAVLLFPVGHALLPMLRAQQKTSAPMGQFGTLTVDPPTKAETENKNSGGRVGFAVLEIEEPKDTVPAKKPTVIPPPPILEPRGPEKALVVPPINWVRSQSAIGVTDTSAKPAPPLPVVPPTPVFGPTDTLKPIMQESLKPIPQEVLKPILREAVKPIPPEAPKPILREAVKPILQEAPRPIAPELLKLTPPPPVHADAPPRVEITNEGPRQFIVPTTVPVGAMPGGAMPGGVVPGGVMPGGAMPGGVVPTAFVQEGKDKVDKDKGDKDKLPPVLPDPRKLPFAPEQVRMHAMDIDAEPLGATPRPTQKELEEYAKYVKGFIDPNNTIDLIEKRARLMILKDTPKRIQVSDETILNYTQFPGANGRELSLLGKTRGTTVLTFWFASADDKNKEIVLSYLVRVFPDPEEMKRLERVYKALEIQINKNFPDSLVRLQLVGDKVLVTGQAHDIEQAAQILKLVATNTPGAVKTPSPDIAPTPRPDVANPQKGATPGAENYLPSGNPNVINMLRVAGVHQVMLKVVVAEVNRTAARSIGMNFSYVNKQGITIIENRTGGLVIPAAGLGANAANAASSASAGTGLANLPINLDNGQISLAINALKKMSYAKSLAEPNLTTLNGQAATFMAGGQFPVPVVAGNGVGGLGGVSYVPFGVQLQFTPFVTDKDRIRLSVSATISTRDTSTGTNISGSAVPGLTSRNFNSTVEMRDGETLAVAGLIQMNHGTDRDQLPFLGTLPIINRLTGFDRSSAGEQELIVLVTPELVQPMHPYQVPRVPGSDLFEPSDLEFYLLGRLEGRRPVDFRSPVMNDFHRIHQYNCAEQRYIFGPTGFSNPQGLPK